MKIVVNKRKEFALCACQGANTSCYKLFPKLTFLVAHDREINRCLKEFHKNLKVKFRKDFAFASTEHLSTTRSI